MSKSDMPLSTSSGKHKKPSTQTLNAKQPRKDSIMFGGSPPTQLQLAQLAATLATTPKASKSMIELVQDAIRLWEASGRALSLERRIDELVASLLIFDEQQWHDHCASLMEMLDESNPSINGSRYRDWREDLLISSYRGSEMIQKGWICRRHSCGEAGVLQALFRSKSETPKTRKEKLLQLIGYIRDQLQKPDPAITGSPNAWNLIGMESAICRTWHPMHFRDDDSDFNESITMAWSWLESSTDSLSGVISFAPLIRWLAVMRRNQLSSNKSRPNQSQ
jgi:hypothetical protein